ncbi:F-box domain-containing protein [Mycena chlorophos]|uniref:F-box domain-containing protein n=1 Tax=Mycena chlorophos TaxID=658473 RepID=A0A8H6S7N3_MYCCL|nr:F-box domain-containing protein [Mycena chlorophos]
MSQVPPVRLDLEKLGDDIWTPTGVTSRFTLRISSIPSDSEDTRPSTPVPVQGPTCGLGWRFFCQWQAGTPLQFLSPEGTPLGDPQPTISISICFDPHHVRSATYGRLSISARGVGGIGPWVGENLTMTLPDNGPVSLDSVVTSVACRPDTSASFTATVELPNFPGVLPRSLGPKLEEMLGDTMDAKGTVDIKFCLFNRRLGTGQATERRALFAKQSLLVGFSESVDNLILSRGYNTLTVDELGDHAIDESAFEDYDYASDSDLEDDIDRDSEALGVVTVKPASDSSIRRPNTPPLPLST